MNAGKTCTATFNLAQQQYTLSVTIPSGGGTVTGTGINCQGDCTEAYSGGTFVVLTAIASPGYAFSGWLNCDAPSGNRCTVNINSDKTVTATFNAAATVLPIPAMRDWGMMVLALLLGIGTVVCLKRRNRRIKI